jgi:hypothetical protein
MTGESRMVSVFVRRTDRTLIRDEVSTGEISSRNSVSESS